MVPCMRQSGVIGSDRLNIGHVYVKPGRAHVTPSPRAHLARSIALEVPGVVRPRDDVQAARVRRRVRQRDPHSQVPRAPVGSERLGHAILGHPDTSGSNVVATGGDAFKHTGLPVSDLGLQGSWLHDRLCSAVLLRQGRRGWPPPGDRLARGHMAPPRAKPSKAHLSRCGEKPAAPFCGSMHQAKKSWFSKFPPAA
jgi:hypothetical protein